MAHVPDLSALFDSKKQTLETVILSLSKDQLKQLADLSISLEMTKSVRDSGV